jgi:hypothetical protein
MNSVTSTQNTKEGRMNGKNEKGVRKKCTKRRRDMGRNGEGTKRGGREVRKGSKGGETKRNGRRGRTNKGQRRKERTVRG